MKRETQTEMDSGGVICVHVHLCNVKYTAHVVFDLYQTIQPASASYYGHYSNPAELIQVLNTATK